VNTPTDADLIQYAAWAKETATVKGQEQLRAELESYAAALGVLKAAV
jgi:hypothetical protein